MKYYIYFNIGSDADDNQVTTIVLDFKNRLYKKTLWSLFVIESTDQLGWLFTFPTRHRGRGFGWKIAATRGGPKIAAIHRDFARSRRATLSREPITAEYHLIG